MLAHNILYTYVAPFAAHAGLGHRVDVLLLVFGAAALVGIGVAAKLVEHHLRRTVLISLATFFALSVVLALLQDMQPVVYTQSRSVSVPRSSASLRSATCAACCKLLRPRATTPSTALSMPRISLSCAWIRPATVVIALLAWPSTRVMPSSTASVPRAEAQSAAPAP
ncbi:hypothetical protein QUF31_21650 [Dickeya chrysanthemi]|uniref:hypothetical protein n=1 Tax=Dickeya chrysanthemi TaxID=556 RepID=UPI0025A00384|nr:hypothetical protein [Dickeya chrysanthemi]WJM85542.1 hypothetical protein QUF31_21650 [Dickeya chrysanthemi]